MRVPEPPLDWLLLGPPWVRHRTRVDLLGTEPGGAASRDDRAEMVAHPLVRCLVADVKAWPCRALKRHNDASHPLHKLVFLADLGLTGEDDGMAVVVERVLAHRSPEGAFEVLANVSPTFGGMGEDQRAWMLCDAPLALYALAKMGVGEDWRVQAAADHLSSLCRENGWPCAVSPGLGRFRGPGSRVDPCPQANLVSLRALAAVPGWCDHSACHRGAEALLGLWQRRRERRPYLFAMGTDFAKLKAPLIWYDVLHVLDVLGRFPWLREDPRLVELAELVHGKSDEHGRFRAESVWTAWKEWDFGQKREPSPWLTLVVWGALARLGWGV